MCKGKIVHAPALSFALYTTITFHFISKLVSLPKLLCKRAHNILWKCCSKPLTCLIHFLPHLSDISPLTSMMKHDDESVATVERKPRESADHLHMTLTKWCMFGGACSLKRRLGAAESAYPTRCSTAWNLFLCYKIKLWSGIIFSTTCKVHHSMPCIIAHNDRTTVVFLYAIN